MLHNSDRYFSDFLVSRVALFCAKTRNTKVARDATSIRRERKRIEPPSRQERQERRLFTNQFLALLATWRLNYFLSAFICGFKTKIWV